MPPTTENAALIRADTPRAVAISYLAFLLILALTAALHLTTPLVTALFSCFVLSKMHFVKNKWAAVAAFVLLGAVIFWAFVFFLRRAFVILPEIVSTTIPIIVQYADRHGIDLPFDDAQSLRDIAMESVRGALGDLGNFAKIATKEFVLLVIGVVIGIGIFLNPHLEGPPAQSQAGQNGLNLYTLYARLIAKRFGSFFRSFEMVMGAQVLISAINTAFTACFVLGVHLPYAGLVIVLTFLCGLLPIVGNLLSNTLIAGVAFKVSPQMAGAALAFLVVIHKLEYFLNSKIIGHRIRHPMWLTLLALIFGERLMGIPGLILAPVILNFIKVEASKFAVTDPPVSEDQTSMMEATKAGAP
jgi:predicted PurR-regulated permease PerM